MELVSLIMSGRMNNTSMEDFDEVYDLGRQIGKGGFGEVFLATEKRTNTEVIVKIIERKKHIRKCWDIEMDLPYEITVLQKLSHENIVKLIGFYTSDHKVFQLVMEKCEDTMDLYDFSRKVNNTNEFLWSYIFRQVVAALVYMHQHHFIHGDVKSENIIVDRQLNAKLIDFGGARYRGDPSDPKLAYLPHDTYCGSMFYVSPEIVKKHAYTGYPQDVWTLGITLFAVNFRQLPFFDLQDIVEADLVFPNEEDKQLKSYELLNLIWYMLHPDPESRLTIAMVEADPWMNLEGDAKTLSWDLIMREPEFESVDLGG